MIILTLYAYISQDFLEVSFMLNFESIRTCSDYMSYLTEPSKFYLPDNRVQKREKINVMKNLDIDGRAIFGLEFKLGGFNYR